MAKIALLKRKVGKNKLAFAAVCSKLNRKEKMNMFKCSKPQNI